MRIAEPIRSAFGKGKATKKVDLFQRLRNRIQDAETYFTQTVAEWQEYREFYEGDLQLAEIQAELEASNQDQFIHDIAIQNFTWSTVEQYVAMLLEATPEPFVAALDGEQDDAARKVTDMLHAYGKARNIMQEIEAVYRDVVIKGNGVFKIYYDKGVDEIRCKAIDPRYMLPDPSADSLENAEFCAFQHIYSEERAEREWPDIDLGTAETVSTDLEPDDGIDNTDGSTRKILIYEVYHEFGDKLTIYTGEQILWEGDNPLPYNKHLGHRYPATIVRFQYVENKMFVNGLLKQIRPIQTDTNKLNLRTRVHHRLTVNPVMVHHGTAKINTSPGSVIKLNTNDEKAYYLMPPPIPSEVYTTIAGNQSAMDNISGVHEITRGVKPAGVTSGISLEVLQQSAQTRMSGPARAWTYQLGDMWMRVLLMMQVYYAEDRTIAALDGGDVQRVSVAAGDLSAVQDVVGEDGQPVVGEDGQRQAEVVPHEYQVLMQASGELPLSAASTAELALQLAQNGWVDQIGVLDATRFPGREKIVKRMQAAQQAEMQGQMDADAALDQNMAQQTAGSGQDIMAALQQALAPEEMQLVQAVMSGQAPMELLQELMGQLDPQVAELVAQFLQMAGPPAQAGQGQALQLA